MQTTKIFVKKRDNAKKKLFVRRHPVSFAYSYTTGDAKNEASFLEQDMEETLTPAEINALGAALDEANEAAESLIASMDRLHRAFEGCHRELRLARQIAEDANQRARTERQVEINPSL